MTNNYYQKHKEKLQKEAREMYQILCEEEKNKRHNKNFSMEQKQKLVEDRKNH